MERERKVRIHSYSILAAEHKCDWLVPFRGSIVEHEAGPDKQFGVLGRRDLTVRLGWRDSTVRLGVAGLDNKTEDGMTRPPG